MRSGRLTLLAYLIVGFCSLEWGCVRYYYGMEVVKTQQQLDIVQAVHVVTEIRLRYDSSSNSDRGEVTLPSIGAVALRVHQHQRLHWSITAQCKELSTCFVIVVLARRMVPLSEPLQKRRR